MYLGLKNAMDSGGSSSSLASYSNKSSSSSSSNTNSSNEDAKEKQINECIKKYNSNLKVNESYTSDSRIAYALYTGVLGDWEFTYVKESSTYTKQGWYIHNTLSADEGPFSSQYEAIKKYCEDKYK
jgi:cellulose biosynthesis protein BcsQ